MNVNVKKTLYNFKNFGLCYGTSFLLTKTIFRKFEYITRRRAIRILNKKYGYIYDNIKKEKTILPTFSKNIFLFWAQGFESLPEIPEKCVSTIEEIYSDYNIYKIDLKNFSDYVDIDENIISLFNKGNISIQTFSDILRFQLIYKFGGVWCDATLLFFKRINFEDYLKHKSFYSLNIECKEKKNLWGKVYPLTYTTFFFASPANNPILNALNKSYIAYYKDYDFVIDYFLNDYFFILAMMHELDDNSLSKIDFLEGTPFYLLNKIQSKDYQVSLDECKKMPQKLTWKNITLKDVVYNG